MNHFERICEYFRSTELISLKIITNADMGSLWFTNEKLGDEQFCAKVRVEGAGGIFCEEEESLTIHGRAGEIHTRIRYDVVSDEFTASVMDISTGKNPTSKDVTIKEASLLDESQFFQKSTVEDYLDLDYNHISTVIELTKNILPFCKGMIDANKTRSSEDK